MKMAKSYKIIFLITAFVLSIAMAFGMMGVNSVSAAEASTNVNNHFEVSGAGVSASFAEEGLSVSVQNAGSVSFKNDLMINELDIKVKLPAGFVTGIVFDIDSFYVNGNPKKWSEKDSQDGTNFDKTIKNIIKLSYDSTDATKVDCLINEKEMEDLTVVDGFVVLQVRVEDNYLTIAGQDVAQKYNADEKIYYKVKNVDDRIVASDVLIDFFSEDTNAQGTFVIEYVDQKASDASGEYKQSLKLESGKINLAKPRAYINESFYSRQQDGSYKAIKRAYNSSYDLTINACSVLGGYSSLYLVNPKLENNSPTYADVLLESDTTVPNEIRFLKAGADIKFGVGSKVDNKFVVYEEFVVDDVKAVDYVDDVAPIYSFDEIAYASYQNALVKATTVEKEDGTITSVGLGTELEMPSFEDLVFDDVLSYDELSSRTYYWSSNRENDTASKNFKLEDIGEYIYFVTFSDGENEIREDDFFVVDKNNEIKSGIYGEDSSVAGHIANFVFRFDIKDNADIEVKAPSIQGKGYKGVKYTASKFVVDASGCSMEYVLYYNANIKAEADDENWKKIPEAASISDTEYNEDGFNYAEVKKVNFDGKLTFVPTRIGSYKIVCTASSIVSSRFDSDQTIIRVASAPKVVKVATQWTQNKTWSVVFLSVGSLCLVGIIVLLCIKPKEKKDND